MLRSGMGLQRVVQYNDIRRSVFVREFSRFYAVSLIMMLVLPLLFFVSPVKSYEPTNSPLVCTISFEKPVLSDIELDNRTFTQIFLNDCFSYANTGDPALPSYPARILVPKDANVICVSASQASAIRIVCDVANKPVVPQQEYHPLSQIDGNYSLVINETMYNLSDVTFDKIYEGVGTDYCRGFKILTVYLYPVQYLPKQGLLYYLPSITITVDLQYDDCAPLSEGDTLFRGSDSDVDFINSIVANPDAVDSYFTLDDGGGTPLGGGGDGGGYAPLSGGYAGGLCDTSHSYDFVIITSNSLKSTTGYAYNWTSLINHRQSYSGLAGTIVTVEDINACTDYWNTTSTFNDSPAHIREFCKDAYLDWGTEYIILGGDWTDGTSSQQIVPYRLFTDLQETDTYKTMPCDMYYSHLDGNWYYSAGGVWGGGEGCANDLYGELFVGRICAYNASMVSNAVSKIIWYDNCNDSAWLNEASFWGGNLGWTATSKQYMEELRLGTDTYRTFTGFEEWNAAHPDHTIDTSERLYHVDLGANYKNYESNSVEDDNASIINNLDHSDYNSPFGLPNWVYRYNTKPFFGYSQGCLAGRFNAGYAGCEQMICRHADRHAYSLVLNTGYGYGSSGSTNGPSQYLQCYFWDYFFNNQSNNMNNWQLGKAFSYSEDKMGAIVDSQSHAWCYVWYSSHLFGDPAQTLRISDTSVSYTPNPPSGFTATASNRTKINLAWTKGAKADYTRIQQKTGSYPTSISDGTNVYNGTGTSYSNTGLAQGTTYYYRAWSWNITGAVWSSSYSSASATTLSNHAPTFGTPNPTNGSTAQNPSLTWSVSITDSDGDKFNWSIASSNGQSNSGSSASNGTKQLSLSGLSYSTQYKVWVNATDKYSSTTRAWFRFTTRSQYVPNLPSPFSATASNRTKINLAWTKGSKADYARIQQKTGGYPSSISDGINVYNGTSTSCSSTGLTKGTTYYYRAWSWNTTDKVWSSSYSNASATTASNHAPTFGTPNPTNGSTAQNPSLTWSVSITDSDGDKFNWSIASSNGQSNSGSSASNGTKQLSISGLSYTTQYKIWVNVTDNYSSTTRAWFRFTTKALNEPSVPSSFSAVAYGRYQINMTWTKGSKADRTYIEYKTTSSPWNRGEGTFLYNGTGTSTSQSGLSQNATRYYQAWSWNATSNVWSSSYSSAGATTASNHLPSVGSPGPANQSTASILLSYLSVFIGDSDIDNFDWNIETSPGVGSSSGTGASNGTKTCTISGLQYSTTYLWYVSVTDGVGWTNESYTFTTESQPQNNQGTGNGYDSTPQNKAPVADAGGPYAGYANQSISLNGAESYDKDNDTLTYSWDFGDGSTGTGLAPSHIYLSPGNYEITLIVSDGALTDSDSTTATILVHIINRNSVNGTNNFSSVNQNNSQNKTHLLIKKLEVQLGCTSLNETEILNVSANNVTCYLVDTDGDGVFDAFYDSTHKNSSVRLATEGSYLIDVDDDGEWDYVYSSASNSLSSYEQVNEKQISYSSMPMLTIVAIIAAIVVCLIVVFRRQISR